MLFHENYSLKKYNTFNIDVYAKYFSAFSNTNILQDIFSSIPNRESVLILGGGSNILFTKNFDGFVLKNEIKGIDTVHEDEDHVYIKAGAGESWHQFVLHCVNMNLNGAENLSLIPGNVGASPMQNIGAYGAELKDIFYSLETFNIEDSTINNFTLNDCEFGYRESIFKKRYKDQFIILNVTFRLNKKAQFNVSYGAIKEELEKMNVEELNAQDISNAIINIRKSKLPDPCTIGNAGSFFQNPEVTNEKFKDLKNEFPNIIGYTLENGNVKLAAGWLIEQCGWKGYREGDAGCYSKQALVLVNYGNAKGNDVYELSEEIKKSVTQKFSIDLKREVNII